MLLDKNICSLCYRMRFYMNERITYMYNDAWKIYKVYLANHDIAAFTDNAVKLCEKYDRKTDICDLMIWWSARVQGLHDEYMRNEREKGK